MKFPVNTNDLGEWMPHRAPAVWVDQVNSVTAEEGECRVYLRPDANYSGPDGFVRDSSFAEWIAQSYGFISAVQVLSGVVPTIKKPETTFLAQIQDFVPPAESLRIADDGKDWVDVRVRRTHQLGPIALITGEVISSSGKSLAKARLKVFAQ